MCDETESYNQWSESDAGKAATNAETIGAPKENEQYLRNRLWKAYMAGHASGRKCEYRRIMKKIDDALSA